MQTDESKLPLPPWLPWAAIACLAAMLACVGELWLVEKARGRLVRDQTTLAEAALKGEENQLEAERIIGRRQLGDPMEGMNVDLLNLPVGILPPEIGGPTRGAIAWKEGGTRAVLTTSALPPAGPGRDYQLWLVGPGPDQEAECGLVRFSRSGELEVPTVSLPAPVLPGSRFLLVECRKGGERTLREARSGGSIVLASLPHTGSIPSR